ncbi:predicted protein [Chaetoceros tenuissimus]|uniref:Uncharacterized protein n=1 Tax=Chaetoceros tenuissimus TaxID=426638 RepID=A0AAD3CRB5_9STRA|nr:predicted protein [Chaetoceros tenuissimus]
MTEQGSGSAGLSSSYQRRLEKLTGEFLAPLEPMRSINVVSQQGTKNANDASTYRQDARPASDNSGRQGGTVLGDSQRSQTGRDLKRNQSSASSQSFMQSKKSQLEIVGMLLLGIAAYGFGTRVIESITSSALEFWNNNLSGTTVGNLGLPMISCASLFISSSSSYSVIATTMCVLFGLWKVTGPTRTQSVLDILEVIGLTKDESKMVIQDLQVSNLSTLVLISEAELRESLLCNGLLSNRIERIVRSFTAFRLKWTGLSDSEKVSFHSTAYSSLDHSKWIKRLEASRVSSPRSPKTFDFGSLSSPMESAASSKKVDFATPARTKKKFEDSDSSESEDSEEDSSDDDNDFDLFFSPSAARSVQAKKNPMPSIPCNANKKEKYDMQAKNDMSTAGVLSLVDGVSPFQEPVWNGGPKKRRKWKKYKKEKLMYHRGNDWLKSYYVDSALASNHPLCKHLLNVVDGVEAYNLVQTHLDPCDAESIRQFSQGSVVVYF